MTAANETRRQFTAAELIQMDKKELIRRLTPEVERMHRATWPDSKFPHAVKPETIRLWRRKSTTWLGDFLNYCLAREKWAQPCDQNQGGQS